MTRTAVFVGDVHLDDEVPERIDRFERFLFRDLPRMGCDKFYLLGDIFNIWYRDRPLAERYGERVLALLSKYTREVGELEFVVGNRDFALGFTRELDLPFPLHLRAIRRRLGAREFHLCHGDDLCVRDHGYRLLHGTIRRRIPMAAFHALGSGPKRKIVELLISLSHEAKKRKARWRMEPYVPCMNSLVDAGADVIVQGHKHEQSYRTLFGKRRAGKHFILPWWLDPPGADPCARGLIYEIEADRFRFFGLR